MSNSRYGPSSYENRFGRDRTPPRGSSHHGGAPPRPDSTGPANGPPATDVPRGPKALADGPRGGAQFAAHPARGRGAPPPPPGRLDTRPNFRDREAPRSARDSSPPGSWRDRDRDRRTSPPDRSASSDFRDFRDAPSRDFDAARGRRGSHSSNSRFADTRPTGSSAPSSARDDPSRGRGRFEFGGRGRGRLPDERPQYRPRSRTPPRSHRWDKDAPRDDRPPVRYEDADRRDADRDDRSRDGDRHRRDQPPTPSSATSRSGQFPFPSQPTGGHANTDGRRGSYDRDRDAAPPLSRVSTSTSAGGLREGRVDYGRNEPIPKKEDPPQSRFPSRPSSPPRATEVPPFGSVSFRPSTGSSDAPWNVWRASTDQKPAQAKAQPSSGPSPTIKAPPTGPKAELDSTTPIAPRAPRIDSHTSPAIAQSPRNAPSTTTAISSRPKTPSGPSATASPVDNLNARNADKAESSMQFSKSPPTGPRQLAGVPSGPKSMSSMNIPSGPKASLTSPNLAHSTPAVPTGPKAERGLSSQNIRAPSGPSGNSPWLRGSRTDGSPQQQRFSGGVIPAKRDVTGIQKDPLAGGDETRMKDSVGHAESEHSFQRDKEGMSPLEPAQGAGGSRRHHRPGYASDEEDAMDLDEGDIESNEVKFQQNKARLDAQKIDLSSVRLQASLPLRELEMLSRLALEDLSAFFDAPKSRSQKAAAAQSRTDVLSPHNEEDVDPGPIEEPAPPPITPSPIGTPEVQSLPFLNREPLTPLSDFDTIRDPRKENLKVALREKLEFKATALAADDDHLRRSYQALYRQWRTDIRQLDDAKAREETEGQEETESPAPIPIGAELSPVVTASSEPRGRTGRLHASELDYERVLELSRIEAAQEAQKRRERDFENVDPDYEREAEVPPMASDPQRSQYSFVDISCLRDPINAVEFYELVPPADDFSKEEHDALLQNFKEYPKKFGKIAQGLPSRNYKDCINHYYATKWNGQYKPPKDKRRRNVKGPRPRNFNLKPKANNLLSNLDDARPDLYDGDEAGAPVVAVTERGRPRRAAAPYFHDKESSDHAGTSTPNRRGKGDVSASEGPVEKGSRRPKNTGEKRQRKPRVQQTGRRRSISPEKADNLPLRPSSSLTGHSPRISQMDGAASLPPTGPLAGDPDVAFSQQNRANEVPSADAAGARSLYPLHPASGEPVPLAPPSIAPTVKSGSSTSNSSYWSVDEIKAFDQLVALYGTDWGSIASHLGNKSVQMVKNYFGRNKETRPGLLEAAMRADKRLSAGDSNGATAPALSGGPRKKPESHNHSGPRPLAPNTAELVNLDEETHQSRIAPAEAPNVLAAAPSRDIVEHDGSYRFGPYDPRSLADERPPQVATHSHSRQHTSESVYDDRARLAYEQSEIGRRPVASVDRAQHTYGRAPSPAPAQFRPVAVAEAPGGEPRRISSDHHPEFDSYQAYGSRASRLVPNHPRPEEQSPRRPHIEPAFGPVTGMSAVVERRIPEDPRYAAYSRPTADNGAVTQSQVSSYEDGNRARSRSGHFYESRLAPASNSSTREDRSGLPLSNAPHASRPVQPLAPSAPPRQEPRKSNIMAMLNPEPEEAQTQNSQPPALARKETPTAFTQRPITYEAHYAPDRPNSDPTRADRVGEAPRQPSVAYTTSAYPPPPLPRSTQEYTRGNPAELSHGGGGVQSRLTAANYDRPIQAASPYDPRGRYPHEAHSNPSPPPPNVLFREPAGATSPYVPRSSLHSATHLRYNQSPPPPSGPSLAYTQPSGSHAPTHSRAASTSRLADESSHLYPPPPGPIPHQNTTPQPSSRQLPHTVQSHQHGHRQTSPAPLSRSLFAPPTKPTPPLFSSRFSELSQARDPHGHASSAQDMSARPKSLWEQSIEQREYERERGRVEWERERNLAEREYVPYAGGRREGTDQSRRP